ncbi:hypothetical protein [Rubritalea profundi]|nr:hypothetical protein [Rubritalea profundi]
MSDRDGRGTWCDRLGRFELIGEGLLFDLLGEWNLSLPNLM